MAILDPTTGRPFAAARPTSLTDDHRARQLVAELTDKAGAPLQAALDALTAYAVAKLLRIAIAHPEVSDVFAEPGRAVVDLVREYFAGAPTILEQLADFPPPVVGDPVDATADLAIAPTPPATAEIEDDFGAALADVLEIFGRGLEASRLARVVQRVLEAHDYTAAILPPGDET